MTGSHQQGLVFDRDAASHGGYVYTTNQRLSSRLATQRSTDLILSAGCFSNRSVLDIACGDGFYTVRFWDQGRPRLMVGLDVATAAVRVARERVGAQRVLFASGDAHQLPFADDAFELVLVQSVLHHDDDPADMLREAFRLAPEVLIHEPNGNNPGLKLIEKTSHYHVEHGEKSYSTRQLRRWIEHAGGRVVWQAFAGLVPMFCPDWIAQITKAAEPLIERTPLLNAVGCAVCVIVARRQTAPV